MKEQLEHRLKALKAEFESGQRMLAEVEAKQAGLRETLLRISGAIQVLQEVLVQEGGEADGGSHPAAHRDERHSQSETSEMASIATA